MGLNELQATTVINALLKTIDYYKLNWMKQGVIEFLESINEQTDEDFEKFIEGLRLGRQKSKEEEN